MQLGQRRGGVEVADAGAEGDAVGGLLDRVQTRDARHVDQRRELPVLLGHPQPDIGRPGDDHGRRMLAVDVGKLIDGARREPPLIAVRDLKHRAVIERGKLLRDRRTFRRRRARHLGEREPGVDDRTIAGAAAEVAGEPVLDALAVAERAHQPAGIKLHHEARRAEAALRAVLVDHEFLRRMQAAVGALEVLDRGQLAAVQRRHELDARVDRAMAQARRARPAPPAPPCRRRSRLRRSLPWCRCAAHGGADIRARSGSAAHR